MTATSLTASIAGVTYPVLNTTYTLDDKVDERSTLQLTIYDANNTYSFLPYQPVTITDTLEGIKFTGFVSQPIATKYDANNALSWQLACVDNEFLAGKKTSNRVVNNQYSGIAAASMVNDYLSQDGIVANYAIRDDNSQLEFAQGTLNGTVATSNLGGDLELALAGSVVTIVESTTSNFGTGTLNNTNNSNNSLLPATTNAIKIQGTESITNDANAYTYVEIAQVSIGIIANRYVEYDIWIDSSSPNGEIGVDFVCTDGTTWRDHSQYNDLHNIPPHPKNDISGYAFDQWYHRKILISNGSDTFNGKTIKYVTVAIEGDAKGIYTGYIKNIYETDGAGTNINTFYAGSFLLNPPKQLQNNGYTNVTVTSVATYDCTTQVSNRISGSYNVSNVNLLKSSFLSYKTTLPPNTGFTFEYSLDGGNSYTLCTNNAPLPNLPAGTSLSGLSIQFRESFLQLTGANPELSTLINNVLTKAPALTSVQLILNPTYTASKSDVYINATTTAQWNAGTLSNTQAVNNVLSTLGAVRNWHTANLTNMTVYGDGATGPGPTTVRQLVNFDDLWVVTGISMEGRSYFDFTGTWADGIIEGDIYVDVGTAKYGFFYRTTGRSNYDSNCAYYLEITPTAVTLQRGSNSSAGSTGTRTQVATAAITVTGTVFHHIECFFQGSTHTVYFDDVQLFSVSDGTYTAAGACGFRVSNSSASAGYQGQLNNFGIGVIGLSGTWYSPSTSLTACGTNGGTVVSWEDVSIGSQSTSILVESTTNGGSSWQTVVNGGSITSLTLGQSLSGVSLQLRVTLTTSTACSLPQIQYLVCKVLGGFSSSGTRIAPFLPLSNALIAGSTLTSWVATTPPNTSVAVSTSLNGSSYSSATNGGGITGITAQPTASLDTFSYNTSPNYLQTIRTGGTAGVFFWDTLNSRLSVAGGTNALLLLSSIPPCANVDMILDFDQSDQSGLVWRWVDASDFYELDVFDASSSAGATNIIRLFKVISNVTPLTLYGSDVADATLTNACDMATSTGGTETSKTSTGTGSNAYQEIYSQGGSPASVTSIPATPTGFGWCYKPGAVTIPVGNWSASETLACTFGTGAIVTLRAFKYSSGTYTLIGTIGTATITGHPRTTYSFGPTSMPQTTFISSDYIYFDLWWNDTGGNVSGDNPVVYESTSSSAGFASDMQVITPGFGTGSTKTQLGSDVPVTLTRGYKYRLHLSMIGTAINVWIDGASLISTTDSSLSAAGQVGIIEATGIGRFYNFRVQPQGDNLSGKVVYSQVTLTSTDPTQTPQLTDLTVAALHPNIGIGTLIPNADYTNTYISDNAKDLAKKSDYTTYIDQNLNFIFGPRVAQPAPWILQSADQKLLIDGPLTVDYSADLYRNEMVLQGVVATGVTSETKIGDGQTTSWNLGGILIAQPTILLNNQPQTVGIKGLTTGMQFYWTPNSTAIDQDASGTLLQQTDTLSFPNYEYQFTESITVDNTNLAGTITQKQFAQRMGRTLVISNIYNGASAAHTVSGDAGDLDVSKARRIAVDVNITAVSGTTPTIQFFVDRKGVDGNYYNLWSSSVVNAASQVSVTIGAFATINQALGAMVKLRWTITGSTPSFTFSISAQGTMDVQSAGLGIVAVVEDVSSQSLNVAAATAYGNTLLQRYGVQGQLITCKTWRRNPSLAIGQYLPVFIPEHNLNDVAMLITEISTVQDIGYETSNNPTQVYFQTLTLTSSANVGSAWRLLSSNLK